MKSRKPTTRSIRRTKTAKPAKPASTPSTTELDRLVAEATVDAYDVEEQVSGFWSCIEEELELPFHTEVLGVAVTVEKLDVTESNDIVAVCRRDKYRQRIRLADLPLPKPEPKGAMWIAAYRHWLREGPRDAEEDE